MTMLLCPAAPVTNFSLEILIPPPLLWFNSTSGCALPPIEPNGEYWNDVEPCGTPSSSENGARIHGWLSVAPETINLIAAAVGFAIELKSVVELNGYVENVLAGMTGREITPPCAAYAAVHAAFSADALSC